MSNDTLRGRALLDYLRACNITAWSLYSEDADEPPPEARWAENYPDLPAEAKTIAQELAAVVYPWASSNAEVGNYYRERTRLLALLGEHCPVAAKHFALEHQEHEGECLEVVWRYAPSGDLIRATGYTYSYAGVSEWSELELVEPYTVTVTKYRERTED